jgi:hypothetical protein
VTWENPGDIAKFMDKRARAEERAEKMEKGESAETEKQDESPVSEAQMKVFHYLQAQRDELARK